MELSAESWDALLSAARRASPQHQRHWFEQLQPVSLAGGVLTIAVPDETKRNFLEQHCRSSFTEAAQTITGRLVSVRFTADSRRPQQVADEAEPIRFSPDYTFEQFVVGPCNRLAHAACVAVSESPGKTYNPLFIHGASGLGKTHLMQATCQATRTRNPNLKIIYLSCEQFVNDFVAAVEAGKLQQFRYRYRHADLLVIDDIQFLANREGTQEEFFHTFNTLYQAQRQIVLSADCPPAQIPSLEERLVSRFEWGLVAPIDRPGFETRMAIVRKKAKLRGIEVPEAVVSLIAAHVRSNIRELEGALTKVHSLALLEHRPITLELAEQALGTAEPVRSQVTIQQIFDLMAEHFAVRISDLQGKRRTRSIAFPRQVGMYLARRLTRHSLGEIGGYFGGRDHTTVLHATRAIEQLLKNDAAVRETVNSLISRLQQS